MKITIEIDSVGERTLTPKESQILQLLAPGSGATLNIGLRSQPEPADEPTDEPETKPEPKPRRGRRAQAKPEPVQDELPEPDTDDDDDILGTSDAKTTAYTLDDAVTRATNLVNANKGSAAKEVLKGLGVRRVTELDAEGIQAFMAQTEG